MNEETWEQTKARMKKDHGINLKKVIIDKPKLRYEEPIKEVKIDFYEVRKILLPIDPGFPQGKVVVSHVTKEEADWWIAEKLKVRSYQDDKTDMKTLVFYEKFLIGGTPKERNLYSNPTRFCTVEFPDFKLPKRIN